MGPWGAIVKRASSIRELMKGWLVVFTNELVVLGYGSRRNQGIASFAAPEIMNPLFIINKNSAKLNLSFISDYRPRSMEKQAVIKKSYTRRILGLSWTTR